MSKSDCPVIVLALQVASSTEEMKNSIKQLSARMRLCDECETPCQVIRDLSRSIDQAILQIVDELHLRV